MGLDFFSKQETLEIHLNVKSEAQNTFLSAAQNLSSTFQVIFFYVH